MATPPLVVFCTTVKNRAQHLEQTLPLNLAHNESYPNAKFVVLDYNSRDNLNSYLRQFSSLIESGRLVLYRAAPEDGPFRMAHAKNMVHRLGILEGADILVNLDADNLTGPDFARYVADKFAAEGACILLWARSAPPVLEGANVDAPGVECGAHW